jgi:hypothetical protein
MVKRTRLKKGNGSRKKDRLQILKSQIQNLPNERLQVWATISGKEALANPSLGSLKELATKELEQRAKLKAIQKKGAVALLPKQKTDVREKVQKAVDLFRKGSSEFMKVLTGVKAQELEESIASIGMSNEEKKKFHAERVKQMQADAEEEERLFGLAPSSEEEAIQKAKTEAKAEVEREIMREKMNREVEKAKKEAREEARFESEIENPNDVYDIIEAEARVRDKERNTALFDSGNVQDMVIEGNRMLQGDFNQLAMDKSGVSESSKRHTGKTKDEDVYDIIAEGQNFVAEEQSRLRKDRRRR